MGKAKILNLGEQQAVNPQNYNAAQTMTDLGKMLLQSVGLASPDDDAIQAAVEANDEFIQRLEAIRDQAQATIEQDN